MKMWLQTAAEQRACRWAVSKVQCPEGEARSLSVACLEGWGRGQVPWQMCLAVTTVLLIVLFSYPLWAVQETADLIDGLSVLMKLL